MRKGDMTGRKRDWQVPCCFEDGIWSKTCTVLDISRGISKKVERPKEVLLWNLKRREAPSVSPDSSLGLLGYEGIVMFFSDFKFWLICFGSEVSSIHSTVTTQTGFLYCSSCVSISQRSFPSSLRTQLHSLHCTRIKGT